LRRTGIDRFGRDIIKATRGATPVTERPPRGVRPRRRSGRFLDPQARDRFEALRAWRKAKAAELNIDPDVVIGNATLEDLARQPPPTKEQLIEIPEMSGWRGELFANALFEAVSKDGSYGKKR
ncbi:MAG: HRDC domain-containing protein, partial [Myxococcota bacterium]